VCDLSALLADTPELVGSVAVVSCPCGRWRMPQAGDRLAAVVLAVRRHDKVSKLMWLLRLRHAVWQAKRVLARQRVVSTATLAVWPSLERSMIVYDIGTTAARYAESRVLPVAAGGVGRVLRTIAGVDMSVDVVVVLGCLPSTAESEERRR
jgi:hypothetical protein